MFKVGDSEGITDDMAYSANSWKSTFYDPDSGGKPEYIRAFSFLWDSNIEKKDLHLYGWKANPYVWVIEQQNTMQVRTRQLYLSCRDGLWILQRKADGSEVLF